MCDEQPFFILQPGFSAQIDDGSVGTPSVSSNAFCSGIDRDTARVVFPPTSISPTLILCKERIAFGTEERSFIFRRIQRSTCRASTQTKMCARIRRSVQ